VPGSLPPALLALLPLGGFAIGIASAVVGLGGGAIVVPLLVLGGASAQEAVATSLVLVLAVGAAGAWQHARLGQVDLRRAAWMALGALPAAPLGGLLARQLSEAGLRGTFALLLGVLGLALLRRPPAGAPAIRGGAQPVVGALLGAGGGFLAGLFGIGGGALFVPMQILLLGASPLAAVGTSLAVLVVSSGVALADWAWHGEVRWSIGGLLALGALFGAPLGARLARRLPERAHRLLLAALLGGLGAVMVRKAWEVAG
jgi:uncharacterized membrane protein YfcA